jgi:HSP20 family molecular chaperone IbpA
MAERDSKLEKAGAAGGVEHTRSERHYTPAVDIYETESELVMLVDLPGVAKEDVDLDLEKGVLSIFGRSGKQEPDAGFQPLRREFERGHYHRHFHLSDEIDAEGIAASMSRGVLRLTLPKVSAAQSRKVEIKAG